MKAKTIKKMLSKKFNNWVDSIDDEDVKKLVKVHTIITGGAIVSMLLNEEVKDYDIYFTNKETTLAVARYYCDKFNEKHGDRKNKLGFGGKAYVLDCDDKQQCQKEIDECGNAGHTYNLQDGRVKIVIRSDGVAADNEEILEEPFEDIYDVLEKADELPAEALETTEPCDKYKPVFLSSNAITLTNKIQLVVRFHGDAEEIHKNYDFTHCTNYWLSCSNTLVLNPDALECILSKELRYQGSKYPICSVIRTRKFIRRGWQINAGQYLKMMFQVSKLDLTDIATLEDQLVGVDSAYFNHLIDALRLERDRDSEFLVTESYVTTIIDKLF